MYLKMYTNNSKNTKSSHKKKTDKSTNKKGSEIYIMTRQFYILMMPTSGIVNYTFIF